MHILRTLFAALVLFGGVLPPAHSQQTPPNESDQRPTYFYIDAELARSSEILSVATALAERSEILAERGEVVVVVADPEPRIHFRGSDPLEVRQGLSTLGLRTFGDARIANHREEFAEAGAAATASIEVRSEAARSEADLLRSRIETLVLWMADHAPGPSGASLLLFEPAIGIDPEDFYQTTSSMPLVMEREVRLVATAYGWTVAPIIPYSEPERSIAPIGPSAVGVRVGIPWQGTDTSFNPDLKLEPDLDAHQRLATDPSLVVQAESDWGPVLRQLHAAAGAMTLDRESATLASDTVIRARGRAFLRGDDEGALPIDATLRAAESGFDLAVAIDPEAVFTSDSPVWLHVLAYDEFERANLTSHRWPAGTTSWNSRQSIPRDADQIVVFVGSEDASLWGMAFATERVDRSNSLAEAAPSLTIPNLPAIGLTGRQRFTVESAPEVAAIEVLLDGRRVDSDGRRPFEVSIQLGKAAVEHSLVIIGYDEDDNEIARTGRTLNSADRFSVEIVSPLRLSAGAVDVVAQVTTPNDRDLRAVDFYWQTRHLGTSTEAPHRQRVLVPLDAKEDGYVRAVATLEDGRVAEDILLAGRENFTTAVTVELMELYVVVTDQDERPVRNLGEDAFEILENSRQQEIEHFRVAGDLPLTVGLAIDSSLSLFRKLPEVQRAATSFVRNLVSNRDRAFLVGFGDRARLEQPPTWDLNGVAGAISRLEPSGNTAVWEAINFSLGQLEAVSGRRALVVFYDGDDEDLSFNFSTTLERARRSRLPVYLVVLNDEAARTQGKGFAVRSRIGRLEKLAAAGGGKVFYVRTDDDLEPVFRQIGEELRSHYLLAYYPEDPSLQPEWRPVRVGITRDGLKARTVEGYVR